MQAARQRVAEEWTDQEKQSRYLQKNIDVIVLYDRFKPGQDGYAALAMIQAFAEQLQAKVDQRKVRWDEFLNRNVTTDVQAERNGEENG